MNDNKISKQNAESFDHVNDRHTSALMESSFKLKAEFTRAAFDMVELKTELEKERDLLHDNTSWLFKKKDLQIDRIIRFYNKVEQITNNYENLFQLLKLQNVILEDSLNGKIMSDEQFRKDFLNLKY
ncbi:MAG: hypothetical protein HC819_04025 [Cyclobacteriaceae bacterium]|nr:hypothetical protein [Cyclobacteriaceae bacterium]